MSDKEKRELAGRILEALKNAEIDFFMHRTGWYEPRLQVVIAGLDEAQANV